MRICKVSYKGRDGRTHKSAKWYAELTDHLGIVRRICGFTDKRASDELGRKLERLVSLRIADETPDAAMTRWIEGLPGKLRQRLATIGLLDPKHVASAKAVREHVREYEQSLQDAGNTREYVQKTVNRVGAVLDGSKAVFLTDLSATGVAHYLAERRKGGLSVRSSNHYLAAMKSFAGWLVKHRRLSVNPFDVLSKQNANANRKHVRRPLEIEELHRLLAETRSGPDRHGMSGEGRYWLYRTALETGLRSAELRSLTRNSFDLNGPEPWVTIEAASAKNRKTATLPLRSDTAFELRAFLSNKLPTAKVFQMPRPEDVVVMLRGDLEAAGIPYADETGRVADFHSLRGTFASLLLRAGVDVRTAKELMRHSTIAMTADVYACTLRGSEREAVKQLPSLATAGREAARATGTHGAENVLPVCLPDLRAATCIPLHRGASSGPSGVTSDNPINAGVFDESRCVALQESAGRATSQEPPPRGLEPLSSG